MKEKLIELLLSSEKVADEAGLFNCHKSRPKAELIADYLIQNDVLVPFCKVGDTVWRIEDVWHLDDKETWTYHYEKEVLEFMVRSISIFCNSKGR